jgi:transcriptional regulator with XRE-family HTH domain
MKPSDKNGALGNGTKPQPESDSGFDAQRLQIGHRLRRLRANAGRTQRQVAEDLGVAPSALSMLESGRTGVSLERLHRIAQYFDVPLVDFFTEIADTDGTKPRVRVIRQAHSSVPSVERGHGVIYQLPGAGFARLVQSSFVTFAPGASYEHHKLAHPGEELVYVLSGEVELLYAEDTIKLSQGDMAIFRTETQHAFKNASRLGPAMLMAVGSPPW